MPQTKKKLFEAAARLFAEKGYAVVTVREIGAAAGTNDSAIYRHFKDKEDILDGIMDDFLRRLKGYLLTPEKVDELIETDTPRQLLVRCFSKFHKNETEFMLWAYRIVCMEQLTNQKARDIITGQLHKETAKSIEYVLDQLAERGKIPEYDRRFFSEVWTQFMFSGSMMWMYHFPDEQKAARESKEIDAINHKMIDMALSGKIP